MSVREERLRRSPGASGRAGSRVAMDRFDLAVLAAFALASCWFLAVLAVRWYHVRGAWTGVEGLGFSDQAQYLGWIQDSAHRVLVGNLFQTEPTTADFLHPGLVISGRLVALGVPAWLAYLAWKPVAVAGVFLATRSYVRERLGTPTARRFALVIALFFYPLSVVVTSRLELAPWTWFRWTAVEQDLSLLSAMWGYPFAVIAVAAAAGTLLTYERARAHRAGAVWPPLLALIAAWLQPWQGAMLIAVLVGAEVLLLVAARRASEPRSAGAGGGPPLRLLASTLVLVAVPLVYYAILGDSNAVWERMGRLNRFNWSVWPVLAASAPLAIPAIVAYRRVPRTFGAIALRLWPPAGFAVFAFIALTGLGTFAVHALIGLSIPLAVLAVEGVGRIARGRRVSLVWAVVGTAVLLVPPLVWQLNNVRKTVASGSRLEVFGPGRPYFMDSGDDRALTWLRDARPRGGVLAPVYLGQLVPGLTGHATWAGTMNWTPDFPRRTLAVAAFFAGRLGASGTRDVLRASRARFIFVDCKTRTPASFERLIAPMVEPARRFGCARVYRVRPGALP